MIPCLRIGYVDHSRIGTKVLQFLKRGGARLAAVMLPTDALAAARPSVFAHAALPAANRTFRALGRLCVAQPPRAPLLPCSLHSPTKLLAHNRHESSVRATTDSRNNVEYRKNAPNSRGTAGHARAAYRVVGSYGSWLTPALPGHLPSEGKCSAAGPWAPIRRPSGVGNLNPAVATTKEGSFTSRRLRSRSRLWGRLTHRALSTRRGDYLFCS